MFDWREWSLWIWIIAGEEYQNLSKGVEWGQNEKRIEREMDLINQMTDDSMVDTEKNMSIEIPEGEDRYEYSYRRYKEL